MLIKMLIKLSHAMHSLRKVTVLMEIDAIFHTIIVDLLNNASKLLLLRKVQK